MSQQCQAYAEEGVQVRWQTREDGQDRSQGRDRLPQQLETCSIDKVPDRRGERGKETRLGRRKEGKGGGGGTRRGGVIQVEAVL